MNSCNHPEGSAIIFENGTIIGALSEAHNNRSTKYAGDKNLLIIPEIVISASYSNNSLNRSRIDILTDSKSATTGTTLSPAKKSLTNSLSSKNNIINNNNNNNSNINEENATIAESRALLDDANSDVEPDAAIEAEAIFNADARQQQQQQQQHADEFEQFVLNRSTSESNMLDSSAYSELQFPPSISSCESASQQQQLTTTQASTAITPLPSSSSSSSAAAAAAAAVVSPPTPPPSTAAAATSAAAPAPPSSNAVVDVLNSSACSRESRQNKRTRRKHKSKSKCNGSSTTVAAQRATPNGVVMAHGTYPPQYTALFLDPHMQHHHHHIHQGAANAIGQIGNAAVAPATYLPQTNDATAAAAAAAAAVANNYLQQQFQYYQQRPMMTSVGHFNHHRSLLETVSNDVTNAISTTNTTAGVSGSSGTTRSFLTASSPFRICFRKWFSRPSLPFVIGILALGGVACTLGGIVLGSTGLVEHSTQYLSAALLMIGIGVSLLVISGAIWRLSLPDDVDECPCYRHMEACRNCNSPYCNNRLLPGNYLYPEFQHRPPPPSYLTSLNECAAMGLLFHPATAAAAQAQHAVFSHPLQRINTPPPLYRSTNSLSVVMPAPNTTSGGTASSQNAASGLPGTDSVLPSQNVITMSAVMENIQAQTQQFTKEINYLDLD